MLASAMRDSGYSTLRMLAWSAERSCYCSSSCVKIVTREGTMRLARSWRAPLQAQQELLSPETTAIAAEFAILPDNAMAGDHNRDSIISVGSTDGTLCTHASHVTCLLFVTDCMAVR